MTLKTKTNTRAVEFSKLTVNHIAIKLIFFSVYIYIFWHESNHENQDLISIKCER